MLLKLPAHPLVTSLFYTPTRADDGCTLNTLVIQLPALLMVGTLFVTLTPPRQPFGTSTLVNGRNDSDVGQEVMITYSPDGTQFATVSGGLEVHILDATTGAYQRCLRGHTRDVLAIAYSPDGTRIATGSADSTVQIWEASTGVNLTIFRGHSDFVIMIAYSPDGTQVVSGSNDQTIRVWAANVDRMSPNS